MTPKSYLNFIAGYKSIYCNKRKELSEGALRMDTGLEKLAEASSSVEILKKELAAMEQELADASQRAETVLTEVSKVHFQKSTDHVVKVGTQLCASFFIVFLA